MAAASSAKTMELRRATRPAGIVRSPVHSLASIAAFDAPVTTHMRSAALSIAARVRVMRRRPGRPGHRDVPVRDVQHRVARRQRGGVPVLAEPEMHQIEPAVPAMPGDGPRVRLAGPARVPARHRHEVQVRVRQAGIPQDRGEPGGVAVRVAVRRLALVGLEHVDRGPREIQLDQAFEHLHGVRPPLSATQNAPCPETAAPARPATWAAAAAATSSPVRLTSISSIEGCCSYMAVKG